MWTKNIKTLLLMLVGVGVGFAGVKSLKRYPSNDTTMEFLITYKLPTSLDFLFDCTDYIRTFYDTEYFKFLKQTLESNPNYLKELPHEIDVTNIDKIKFQKFLEFLDSDDEYAKKVKSELEELGLSETIKNFLSNVEDRKTINEIKRSKLFKALDYINPQHYYELQIEELSSTIDNTERQAAKKSYMEELTKLKNARYIPKEGFLNMLIYFIDKERNPSISPTVSGSRQKPRNTNETLFTKSGITEDDKNKLKNAVLDALSEIAIRMKDNGIKGI